MIAPAFRIGIVEGFFGRQWSWPARLAQVDFLAQQHLNTYVYAPKNDVYLRKQWFTPYPAEIFNQLRNLAHHAAQQGLAFGVGLSPFELYRDFSGSQRELLLRKVEQLNQLTCPLLAVLFDDMLGALPGLAETQLAIFDCIRQHSNAQHFLFCPTYYSDDPLLVKHFGEQPNRYLEIVGQALPAEVQVFWTGPKVISHSYPSEHLQSVAARLQRKPLLWDNYPVNDAQRLTGHLHLLPFATRPHQQALAANPPAPSFSFATIAQHCSGLLANPMNQAALSQLSLQSLGQLWRQHCNLPESAPTELHGAVIALLQQDCAQLQFTGLPNFSATDKKKLLQRYQEQLPNPLAAEVYEWLQGGYAFDPACLT